MGIVELELLYSRCGASEVDEREFDDALNVSKARAGGVGALVEDDPAPGVELSMLSTAGKCS